MAIDKLATLREEIRPHQKELLSKETKVKKNWKMK